MAIAMGATISAEGIKEQFAPVVEKIDETVRKGRKAFVRGQHAAEDAAVLAGLGIRRRPLTSVMIAAAVGALLGALVGFALSDQKACSK